MPPKTLPHHAGKIRSWTLPTVLGIILGVVGSLGVIELRPQMGVIPQDPLTKSQPFSVPFRIDNVGYFSFPVDHVFAYIHRVKASHITIDQGTYHEPSWNRFDLDRGEGKTVIVKLINFASNEVPSEADIALIVDYRPFRFFPASFRRYFRFVGAYGDNWQWLKEPSADIQAVADRQIEDHMRTIPSSR
jgi:hypothetical protein